MTKVKPLVVKETNIDGTKCYGITDGKVWFWWAYTVKESAEKMVYQLTPEKFRWNVNHPKAFKLSDITPDKIKER